MILQVRGNSGSGKSWVMRRLMSLAGDWDAVYVPRRRRPFAYAHALYPWTVLGQYETGCGGCDGVGAPSKLYAYADAAPPGTVFLMEGLLLSEDTKWTKLRTDVVCFFLTTPLERCLDQVRSRRAEAGKVAAFNPHNTLHRNPVIVHAREKLLRAGVDCRRCSAAQAPGLILQLLRLHAQREVRNGSRTDLVGRLGG